ncbi:CLUMA_CG002863, isoform A [Clunio marinus]|uniref:CLUMA_CG002863, isoform A n=1 Tax=Clunio marinus TaxID=568069 RepID=A0A1J1HS80_9DIPT|nr:CLUMA_CG002863, isoform A [Clunio marinus]
MRTKSLICQSIKSISGLRNFDLFLQMIYANLCKLSMQMIWPSGTSVGGLLKIPEWGRRRMQMMTQDVT